jgi:hypothetical protein
MLTRRRKTPDIGHTMALAGDKESPLQAFRWQAGWQMIGIGGQSPAHFANSHRRKEEKQEVRPNASHSGVWRCPSLNRRADPAGAGPALADLKVSATLKMGHHRMFQSSKLETVNEAVAKLLEQT